MYVCFVHLIYVYAGAKTPCWALLHPTTMACPPPHHGKGHLPKGIAACRVCTMPRKGWSLEMVLIVFKQHSVDRKLDHPKEEKPTKIYTPQQLFSNAQKIIIFVQAFNLKKSSQFRGLDLMASMMFWHCENLFRLPRGHHVPFFMHLRINRNYGPNDVL